MSVEKRSALMSRIRGKDTKPERAVEALIRELGLEMERHARDLPGCPDFVLRSRCVAVFVDGDFWHGWRFPQWSHKLTPFWAEKIGSNRARDTRNLRRLRRAGWTVVRVWEHQIKRSPEKVALRLERVLAAPPETPGPEVEVAWSIENI